MLSEGAGFWTSNWLWGLPLVVATALLHVFSLGMLAAILKHGLRRHLGGAGHVRSYFAFSTVMGLTTLALAVLHGGETVLWGVAYDLLDVVPDLPTAIYHALMMGTTLGSDVATVARSWKLLGGIQAIGGWLMFGLSTAFLFAVMEQVRPLAPPPDLPGA